MSTSLVLFNGFDANNVSGLWVTDGTSAGTSEISVAGADATHGFGLDPQLMTVFGSEVLFAGVGSSGLDGLWVTDGTSSGTSEISIAGTGGSIFITSNLAVFGSEVMFGSPSQSQQSGLWVTDGTSAGTSEISVAGANTVGLYPSHFTAFGSEVLFVGSGPSGSSGLWVTNGTSAGTSEISVAGAYDDGLFSLSPPVPSFAVLGNRVLFEGWDSNQRSSLWVTDGTSTGTSEIVPASGEGGNPTDLTAFGSEVLFNGIGPANGVSNAFLLFVTDGTPAGTSEISVTDANASGVNPSDLTVFGSEVVFAGTDASGNRGLWITNGTSAGTSEISVSGAAARGLFSNAGSLGPDFVAFGSEVLFEGQDANGRNGLWVTDGTSGGTSEIPVAGASDLGVGPTYLAAFTQQLVRPALNNVPAIDVFAARGTPITLAPTLDISDTNSTTLVSAVVSISGGTFANDADVLAAATTGTGITASYNSSTETLTLTGTDTLSNYSEVLDSITFGSSNQNPTDFLSNPTRIVTWVVNDGTASNNLSAPQTTTVTISHPAPTLSGLAASASFTEESPAVILSPSLTVTDQDSLTLTSATVSITGGRFSFDGDVLAASTAGTGITASYDPLNEVLTLIGVDTLGHYETVLDSIRFSASENPTNYGSNPTRTISWLLNDGSAPNEVNTAPTTTVSLTNVNDAPSLFNLVATPSVIPGATVTLLPFAVVTDPDNVTLAGATVAITGGTFAGDGDGLAANTAGTVIAASYNSTTETLTLSGTDTLPDYQAVLRSVRFSAGANPTDFGADSTRTFTWVLNDGGASNNLSAPATTTISFAHAVTDDFTGDGISDVLWRNASGEVDTWLMMNGQMTGGTMVSMVSSAWQFAGAGDITGNGTSDVLWQNTATGEVDSWLINNGNLSGGTAIGHASSVWQPLGTGDFDADAVSDVLWRNMNTGEVDTWLMNNGQVSGGTVVGSVSSAWQFAGIGDFNNGGTSDILWHNTMTGEVDTWLINNGQLSGGTAIGHAASVWQSLGTGDFNGDGTSDILWRNTTTGEVDTWIMNNGQMTGGAVLGSVSSAWQFAGIGNFTGTGTSDILWRNTATGEVDIWLITNDQIVGRNAISAASTAWQPQLMRTA
jgi:hypothetical protein